MLTNPRVNQHIWVKLKESTKKTDLRLSHVGEKIVKALISSTKNVERLTALKSQLSGQTKQEIKAITKSTLEAIQFTIMALHELSQRRRQEMKFDLHASYRGLCNAPKEESEELFGINLNERVQELNNIQRMGRQVAGDRDNRNRRPFLGARRYLTGSSTRGRYQQQQLFRQNHGNAGRYRQTYKPATSRKGQTKK